MTREEAIEHLEELLNEGYYFDDFGIPNKHGEALSLAITALNGDLGWEFIIFMLEKNYPEDIFGGFDDLGGRTLKAIRWLEKERAALRGWVKTADRVPTEADAGYNEEVVTFYRVNETELVGCDYWLFVAKNPEYFPYWMPLPQLPEVEE